MEGWEPVHERAQPDSPCPERSGLSKRRPALGCAPSREALPTANNWPAPVRASREGAPNLHLEALREDGCKLSRDGDRDSEREARPVINRPLTLWLRVRPVDGSQPLPPQSANSRVRQRATRSSRRLESTETHSCALAAYGKDLTLTGQPLHSRSLRLRASVFFRLEIAGRARITGPRLPSRSEAIFLN